MVLGVLCWVHAAWNMLHVLACMRQKSQFEITIELHSVPVPVVAVVGQELIATLGVCIDWYSAHAIM